jgi:hypothetical protein
MTKGCFKYKIKEMKFIAIFIPRFSWFRKNLTAEENLILLKHEQGHFDLAQEIVKKIRIKTDKRFINRFFIVKGKNKEISKENTILAVTKIRKLIEVKILKELKFQERKYDVKTGNGLNLKQQEIYDKRFKNLRR